MTASDTTTGIEIDEPAEAREGTSQKRGKGYRMHPLPKISRQNQVAEQIKQYIAQNQLRPGDRLPGEAWFASQLNVGRPLIREALKGLEAVGAVEARKGIGRFVGSFDADAYLRHFATAALVQGFTERDLTEARCWLEIAVATETVPHLTDDDLAEIAQLIAAMRARVAAGEPMAKEDIALHRIIVGGTSNPFIAAMLDTIYALCIRRGARRFHEVHAREDLAEHEQIAQAAISRDGDAVRIALMHHFETTAGRLGFTPRWRGAFGEA